MSQHTQDMQHDKWFLYSVTLFCVDQRLETPPEIFTIADKEERLRALNAHSEFIRALFPDRSERYKAFSEDGQETIRRFKENLDRNQIVVRITQENPFMHQISLACTITTAEAIRQKIPGVEAMQLDPPPHRPNPHAVEEFPPNSQGPAKERLL